MSAYNYERFDVYVESGEDERAFRDFPNMLHAGVHAATIAIIGEVPIATLRHAVPPRSEVWLRLIEAYEAETRSARDPVPAAA